MLCPFCREKDTLLLTLDRQRMVPPLEEEDFVIAMEVKDLLHLKEFSLGNYQSLKKVAEELNLTEKN